VVESLERRQLLSASPTNVTDYRYDISSSGVNSNECNLRLRTLKTGSFGKIAGVTLDGTVYAEPLVVTNVTIANGITRRLAPRAFITSSSSHGKRFGLCPGHDHRRRPLETLVPQHDQ